MQSREPAAAESCCGSQDPGLGGLSMGFSLAFCALSPDLAKAFPIYLHPCPRHQFSDCGEKGGSQGFTSCPGGTQKTGLETHWLRLVELNCCQQQRETSPQWSQVYRIPQGAIPFLLDVLKNRWISHVDCLKLSCFISTSDLGAWQMCQTENKIHPCSVVWVLASLVPI